ncbi:metal-dependent hydrolase [Hartmannibacter diazotrophicus]|uniref:UPF0173 metal-dependent hydrolase HDIA_2917 n=1 Tax=Hartmannibacter diazotrophicus TaxID=1482074 RepID=A0A2C9D8J5_9HYPH|nr:metal-dependent hydrolase [Hartmannibacter diazotrophicus]SON56458.1 metal-dependent hydrolase [Hartmannibacter diazotrophicus]
MKLTWFGHSAFRVEIADTIILLDPFFTGNPSFPSDVETASRGVTHIVLTHGHSDHVGDTVQIAQKTGAKVVTNADLCSWLGSKGLEKLDPMNTGGTTDQGAFTVTLVNALHSAAVLEDGVSQSLGHSNGVIIKAPGEKTLYHMGDTDIFGDMALIDEIHGPKIGLVPIGDRFTMGGKVAALACKRFFDFETILPCHYASFVPYIAATADEFVTAMGADAGKVKVLKPGDTISV